MLINDVTIPAEWRGPVIMNVPDPATSAGISLATIALRGRCPACGKGKLFKNLLDIGDYCHHCGLSFAGHEVGDGPASLSVLIVGALAGIGATVTDALYQPPLWVHAVIWIPFIIGGSLLSLRWLKAFLFAVQYRMRKEDFTS